MLSLLCVTSGKPRAEQFLEHFADVADHLKAELVILRDGVDIHSAGYIESVLDEAIARTSGDYILRMDDDEKISPAMLAWLEGKQYERGDHFTFPRVHLWGDEKTIVLEQYYFPDLQTRLSVRAKAGGRPQMHQASPFGGGEVTRVAIEHWTYLVKTYEERCAIAATYNTAVNGSGHSFEDEHPGLVHFMAYSDGAIPMKGRVWEGTCADWRQK